jgi:hypothetical protein
MIQLASLSLTASDVTGQKHVRARNVPADNTVGDLVDGLLPRLRLNQLDRDGTPVHYEARLQREERHLHRSERVGDALQTDDHLVLHPRVVAG